MGIESKTGGGGMIPGKKKEKTSKIQTTTKNTPVSLKQWNDAPVTDTPTRKKKKKRRKQTGQETKYWVSTFLSTVTLHFC